MKKEKIVPEDFDFRHYEAHHAGPPGSMEIEFVDAAAHGKVAHDGTSMSSTPKSATSPLSDICPPKGKRTAKAVQTAKGAAFKGLMILDVVDTGRTVYELAGFDRGTVVKETVQFQDETGSRFVVEESLFGSVYMRYIDGSRKDQTFPVTSEELAFLRREVDDRYGKLEWISTGWFAGHWKFTPGSKSQSTLPIYQKVMPWENNFNLYQMGVMRTKIGYVDEDGEHYYDVPELECEGRPAMRPMA